jgi:TRAP-type mannitol/chloroaromatic compound transport system substrate-binding protein
VKKSSYAVLILSVIVLCVISLSATASAKTVWKMTTVWTPGILNAEADKHFANLVNELSGEEFEIKFFDGGSIVPAMQLFDSVKSGTVQIGSDWPGYWAGKNSAFELLGTCPMGLTNIDYLIWYYQGGGKELYDEIYGKFGMKYFLHFVTPMESGIRSNKPINKLEDLKGMKIRMAGRVLGEVLKTVGAAQVPIAGGEVYQALEKGVIDAAEFSAPSVDYALSLYEVTKYWATPGWHQPASMQGLMINKKAWDSLPKKYQRIIKTAAAETRFWMFSMLEYKCYDATKQFVDKGITITRYDESTMEKLQTLVNNAIIKYSQENPIYAKVAYSQFKFLKDSVHWRNVSSPYSYGRNPIIPDLNILKKELK